jgi:hypothetical protein
MQEKNVSYNISSSANADIEVNIGTVCTFLLHAELVHKVPPLLHMCTRRVVDTF